MATSASAAASPDEALVDSSVAVAIVLADHQAHAETVDAVRGLRLGLAGHAWFETYSVLTRLPPRARRSPGTVRTILDHDFPGTRFPGPESLAALGPELARRGISGGSVYDALVGAAARAHDMTLLSRDRRARSTYEALGVDVRFIG